MGVFRPFFPYLVRHTPVFQCHAFQHFPNLFMSPCFSWIVYRQEIAPVPCVFFHFIPSFLWYMVLRFVRGNTTPLTLLAAPSYGRSARNGAPPPLTLRRRSVPVVLLLHRYQYQGSKLNGPMTNSTRPFAALLPNKIDLTGNPLWIQ